MKAVADTDTMYYHQAMRKPEKADFKKAVESELSLLSSNDIYTVKKLRELPSATQYFPMVWQMRQKGYQATVKTRKHKARLNVNRSRMRNGVDYTETYSLVTTWDTVRLMLILNLVHGWHSKQIYYVATFPQAPIEKPTFKKIPVGMEVSCNPSN